VPIAGALLALVFVAAAGADKEKVRLTKADETKAGTTLLKLSDLGGGASGWSGGRTPPPPDTPLRCAGVEPAHGDLVVTGRAAADFMHPGLEFDNEVELLKTARMVKLDWQRSVGQAALLPCLRKQVMRSLRNNETFVSFKRIGFPKVGDESAAYRGVVRVKSGKVDVSWMIDFMLLGVGRTEITLIASAPFSAAGAVSKAEQRLEQVLVARASPGSA
jgi:hypothetical protein